MPAPRAASTRSAAPASSALACGSSLCRGWLPSSSFTRSRSIARYSKSSALSRTASMCLAGVTVSVPMNSGVYAVSFCT